MDRKYKVGGYVKLAKLWERSKDAAVSCEKVIVMLQQRYIGKIRIRFAAAFHPGHFQG